MRHAAYRTLYGAGRLFERAGRVWFYAAAGVLTRDDLRRAALRRWREFGAVQPESDVALMDWEAALYDRFIGRGDRVLVAGCGSGRDLIALLERGHRAEGLDPVPECVAVAEQRLRRRGLAARVRTGWIETSDLGGPWDVVVLSWHCYSYITGAATRVAMLRAVRAQLAPGGRLLLSYVPGGRPPRPLLIRLARLVGRLSGSDWQPEDGDVLVATDRASDGVHYEHHFRPEDIESEVRAAGLRVVFHEVASEGVGLLAADAGGREEPGRR